MGVLGSLLLSRRAVEDVLPMLAPDDFHKPAHRLIYAAMAHLAESRVEIDYITLREELDRRGKLADAGGDDYILLISEFVPAASNAIFYANIVLDYATRRNLYSAGRRVMTIAKSEDEFQIEDRVDQAQQLLYNIGLKSSGKDLTDIRELAKEFFKDVDLFYATGQPKQGLMTGFQGLDRITTGLYPADLVIVGARPGMGKTAFGLDLARNVARNLLRQEKRGAVAFFSLEMSAVQLVGRMVTSLSGVPNKRLRETNPLSTNDYEDLANACEELSNLPIHIDDSAYLSTAMIRQKCRRLSREHGLSLIVIDYLQLLKPDKDKRNENRANEVGEITRGCKIIAKDFGVPVVALCQLSREVEKAGRDGRPQLSDLRESGSIEADADLVLGLFRESYYSSRKEQRPEVTSPQESVEAEIVVLKHRNGETGVAKVAFQPMLTRFRDWDFDH